MLLEGAVLQFGGRGPDRLHSGHGFRIQWRPSFSKVGQAIRGLQGRLRREEEGRLVEQGSQGLDRRGADGPANDACRGFCGPLVGIKSDSIGLGALNEQSVQSAEILVLELAFSQGSEFSRDMDLGEDLVAIDGISLDDCVQILAQ